MLERIKSIKINSDKVIWILVMLLAMASILVVFSTSSYRAKARDVGKEQFFFEQVMYVAGGFLALILCYKIPLRWYRYLSMVIYVSSLVLMAWAMVGGAITNNTQRGISIGGHSIQVLEIGKVGLIFYLAKAVETWGDKIKSFKDFFIRMIIPILLTCILAVGNSASTVFLLGTASLILLWCMDFKKSHILLTIFLALIAASLMVGIYHAFFEKKLQKKTKAEQNFVEKIFGRVETAENRVISYVEAMKKGEDAKADEKPTQEEIDEERQNMNARIAISEGGIIGKGPGKSTQRFTLSEAFSDFIFASIVEEYGLLGGFTVIFLYVILLFRCIRLALKCEAPFSQALVLGLAILISIQAMLHIWVNVRMFPITGHTLPLISHGGNAMIVFSGVIGIILSVSRQVNIQEEEKRLEEEARFAAEQEITQTEEAENE